MPYPNYWRNNPLKAKRLAVFLTILDQIREQEPDLETARVYILNYGIPSGETDRKLVVVDEADVPRVTSTELTQTLQIFADGYRSAREQLAGIKPTTKDRNTPPPPDPAQDDLFRGGPKR